MGGLGRYLGSMFTKRELEQMAERGANTGWVGLTCWEDVEAVYERFSDEIWERTEGLRPGLLLDVETHEGFVRAMVWAAAQHAAREEAGRKHA